MYRKKLLRISTAPIFSLGAGALILAATAPTVAHAQEVPSTVSLAIDAGNLETGLTQFASQSGYQLLYSSALVDGKSTAGVRGSFRVEEGLARLLSGTGLTFRLLNGRTIQIEAAAQGEAGERVLGAVRVEGAQNSGSTLAGSSPVNGINGSRDVTATEGTGSYTSNALTVGSKTAASIKDTPMSVSVLTNQQMQDQKITDLNGAMRNLPGVSLVNSGSANNYQFFSRGFEVKQVQFDGGAAMNLNPGNEGGGASYNNLIDLSLYDHIEIVRGASGTFNGYGDPGGVINLVRKKPLDHFQILADLQVGSWNLYRGMLDLTGPLAFDGKLRARLIATHQDNRYFYDISKSSRNILSGTLEYDLTPTTLASVGVDYQDSNDLPFLNGFPRYDDGRALGLPRSTCLCFTWASDKTVNTSLFGQIEQRLGSGWTAKLKVTRVNQVRDTLLPNVDTGFINPFTLAGVNANASAPSHFRIRQTMFEGTVDGHFRLFGQDQKIVVGANYSMYDPSGSRFGFPYDPYTYSSVQFPGKVRTDVNVFTFNSGEWREPVYPTGTRTEVVYGDFRYLNAYANFDLTPIKRLHIASGLRYSGYRNRGIDRNFCSAYLVGQHLSGCNYIGQLVFYGAGSLNKGSEISWPPSVQVRYDFTNNVTVSAIYTDIYVDQSTYLDKNNKPLPPITGGNFEGMLKWLSPDKKINVSLSGYYIRQNGFALQACGTSDTPSCTNNDTTSAAGQLNNYTTCCWVFDSSKKNVSYGADFEIAGEIRKGWEISASYNFNRSYQNYSKLFNGRQNPLVSQAPKHKFQLWTTYTFNDSSRFSGLTMGLGAQAQSSTFVASGYCSAYIPDRSSSIPGAMVCDYDNNGFKPVNYIEPSRVIFSASAGYRLSKNLSVDINFENLLDRTYYADAAAFFYGAPRNVKVTLRGKF